MRQPHKLEHERKGNSMIITIYFIVLIFIFNYFVLLCCKWFLPVGNLTDFYSQNLIVYLNHIADQNNNKAFIPTFWGCLGVVYMN